MAEQNETPDTPVAPVELQLSIAKGLDGKHWVALGIQVSGISNFSFMLPPDTADAIAESLPKGLTNAAKEARRLDTGLTIAATLPRN